MFVPSISVLFLSALHLGRVGVAMILTVLELLMTPLATMETLLSHVRSDIVLLRPSGLRHVSNLSSLH